MGRPSKLPLILDALRSATAKARGLTRGEIAQRCGISGSCVSTNIRALHAKRLVHICGWQTECGGSTGGYYQARWHIGDRPDAPKPTPPTSAELSRRFRERAIASGRIEDIRARDRTKWWRKRPARRDPLAAALFGAPA